MGSSAARTLARRERAPIVEQIVELPRVDLEEAAHQGKLGLALQPLEKVAGSQCNQAGVRRAAVIVRRTHHRERFAAPGLSVRETRCLHALEDRLDQRRGSLLVDLWCEGRRSRVQSECRRYCGNERGKLRHGQVPHIDIAHGLVEGLVEAELVLLYILGQVDPLFGLV